MPPGVGNPQIRTPQQQQQQQQQNMLGPSSNVRPQGQQQPPQPSPQSSMMGGIRNQSPQQAQQMGANPMMQQPSMGMGMQNQNPQQNMMNMRGPGSMQQPPMTSSQSTGLFSGSLFSGPRMPFGGNQQQQQHQQPGMNQQGQPSIMQKLGDVAGAVPGGDMLSKGKELIFMKFGLGGK